MAFNINAQVILTGPKNLKSITSNIQKQLSSVNVGVNVQVPKTAQRQVQNLNKQLSTVSATTNKLNTAAGNANKNLGRMGGSAKNAATAMQQLGKETALTFKRFAAAGIVTATFFKLTNAISEAVPKALEFERELVRLQQVTGQSRKGLEGLKTTLDSVAKSLGVDANELANIARIFAQTGQSLDQVEASLKAVARSSLAPTFGSMEQTAEGLIAALNQFGIAAGDAEAVLGALNQVSKKFAVESQDLISAIRRAGGVFSLAATDANKPIEALNQLVGVFTAVRSTTRESSETIATGLRTIFTRIQRRGTIEALRELGINLTDAQGNFVGLFQSFRILSKELDRIVQRGDAITLSAITEELGGIRQVGKLIPAIRNFREAEAAFAEAQKGAAEGLGRDVELGLEPLIKQFEQVQQRFESLIRTISESATFQALAKTAIGLANAFLRVSESLSNVLPAITAFAAVKLGKGLVGFGKGFFGSFGAGGGATGAGAALGGAVTGQGAAAQQASQKAVSASLANLNATNKLMSTNIKGQTTATTALTTQIKTLQTSIVNLIASNNQLRASRAFGIGGGGSSRRRRGFNRGGLVPGTGDRDTVPAELTPGEFVLRKSAVEELGVENLEDLNRQGFQAGGPVVGKVKGKFGLSLIDDTAGLGSSIGTASVSSIRSSGKEAAAALSRALTSQIQGAGSAIDDLDNDVKAELRDPANAGKKLSDKAKKNIAKVRGTQPSILGFTTAGEQLGLLSAGSAPAKFPSKARLSAPGAVVGSVKGDAREQFRKELTEQLPVLFSRATAGLGQLRMPGDVSLEELITKGNLNSTMGNFGEAFIRRAAGQVLEGDERLKEGAFDFTKGKPEDFLGIFDRFKLPNEVKVNSDSKAVASTFGKAARIFGVELDPEKFARGGSVGTDTVPALLTPGEFVINKKSAGKIGLNNLNEMNRFAKGGAVGTVVQRFQEGGGVKDAAKFFLISTLAGEALALLPESVQGISSAFINLTLIMGGFGATFESFKGGFTKFLNTFKGGNVSGIGKTLKGFGEGVKGQIPFLKNIGPLQQKVALSSKKLAGAQSVLLSKTADFQKAVALGDPKQIGKLTKEMGLVTREVNKHSSSLVSSQKSLKLNTRLFKGLGAGVVGIVTALAADPIGNFVADVIAGGEKIKLGTQGIEGREGVDAFDAGAAEALGGLIKFGAAGAAAGAFFGPFGAAIGGAIGAIGGFVSGLVNGQRVQDEFNKSKALQNATKKLADLLNGLSESALLTRENFFKLSFGLQDQSTKLVSALEASATVSFFGPSTIRGGGELERIEDTGLFGGISFAGATDEAFQEAVAKQREIAGPDLGAGQAAEVASRLFQDSLNRQSTATLGTIASSDGLKESIGILGQTLDEHKTEALEASQNTAIAANAFNDLSESTVEGTKEQQETAKRAQRILASLGEELGGMGNVAELSAKEIEEAAIAQGFVGETSQKATKLVVESLQKRREETDALIKEAAALLKVSNEAASAANKLDALVAAMEHLGAGATFAVTTLNDQVSNLRANVQEAISGDRTVRGTQVTSAFTNVAGASDAQLQASFRRVQAAEGGEEVTRGLETSLQFQKQLPNILRDIVGRRARGDAIESPAQIFELVKDAFPNFDQLPEEVRNALETSITEGAGRQGANISTVEGLREVLTGGDVLGALAPPIQKAADGLSKFDTALIQASNIIAETADLERQLVELQTNSVLRSLDIRDRANDALDQFRTKPAFVFDNLSKASKRFGDRLTALGVPSGVTAAQLGTRLGAQQATTEGLIQRRDAIASGDLTGLAPGADPTKVLEDINKKLGVSIAEENNIRAALELMRDDTSLIAAAQEDLKSLQRLQLSAEQTAKADLDELAKIQSETDPGRKAALIQAREDRKGFTALRKIQAGEELSLTDLSNLLGNLDELATTDFALQNPQQFQQFVDKAKSQLGVTTQAATAQLGEPTTAIRAGLIGQDLTQTTQAQALAQIEQEQQDANAALTGNAITNVRDAATEMFKAGQAAFDRIGVVTGEANVLRGRQPGGLAAAVQANPRLPQAINPLFGGQGQNLPAGPLADEAARIQRQAEQQRAAAEQQRAAEQERAQGGGLGGLDLIEQDLRRQGRLGREADGVADPLGRAADKLAPLADGIDLNANIGDFSINLMGTEAATKQLERAVANVSLQMIKEQLPGLIDEKIQQSRQQVG